MKKLVWVTSCIENTEKTIIKSGKFVKVNFEQHFNTVCSNFKCIKRLIQNKEVLIFNNVSLKKNVTIYPYPPKDETKLRIKEKIN